MAVPVDRFVTPEQDFAGLQQVGDTMQRNRIMEERKQEELRQEEKERVGKTAASMRYFANYLDPKDRYTGTYYDPKMNEYLGNALTQAYDLARKGAGEAEILTAISPLVNKANDYQQKAKMYSENKKQLLAAVKGQKGYNIENISKYLDQEMFEGKDIEKVDPADMFGALDNVYTKYGSQITNDEALDELISKLPTSKVTTDIISYNARGGKQRNKAMVDMPNIFVQEEENGQTTFVPRYDKATDFGEDIVAEFEDASGQKVEAPVRLLEQKTFDQIIKSSPAIQHRLGALVNEAIQAGKYTDANGRPLTLNSPQAQNLARAILYDELKSKGQVQRNIVQETKPAQIRNITNVNFGGGGGKGIIDGNEFDRIDLSKVSGDDNSLVAGAVGATKDYSNYTGKSVVSDTAIPKQMAAILKSAGMDIEGFGSFEVEVENGKIQSLTPIFEDGLKDKKITRRDMKNAQLKYNSEPQKGQQPTFGQQPTRVPKDIKQTKLQPKKDPLGLGL